MLARHADHGERDVSALHQIWFQNSGCPGDLRATKLDPQIEKIFGKSARAICAQALNFGFIRACYVSSQLRDNKSQTGTR
jgi:hypothetical protein